MTDHLRRNLAPIPEAAWKQIDETAARVLKTHLTARAIVDFDGPKGWDFSAVNLGEIDVLDQPGAHQGLPWGLRRVLPLLELRVPFTLSMRQVDNAARGSDAIDLGKLEEAARQTATFEETAVYQGLKEGSIEGIADSSPHERLRLPENTADFPNVVAEAVRVLTLSGTDGPFAVVLGSEPWAALMQSGTAGYPPQRIIRNLTDGDILLSPGLKGGLVASTAGGHFQLTVGQDHAVGYAGHDRDSVELFLTETFTFRVLNPSAAVALQGAE
jgi:uncharacterized linocin/CFP29 family protein